MGVVGSKHGVIWLHRGTKQKPLIPTTFRNWNVLIIRIEQIFASGSDWVKSLGWSGYIVVLSRSRNSYLMQESERADNQDRADFRTRGVFGSNH